MQSKPMFTDSSLSEGHVHAYLDPRGYFRCYFVQSDSKWNQVIQSRLLRWLRDINYYPLPEIHLQLQLHHAVCKLGIARQLQKKF